MIPLYSLQLFFPDESVCAVQEIPGGVDVAEMSEHNAVVRADRLLKESYERLPHLLTEIIMKAKYVSYIYVKKAFVNAH